VFLKNNLGRLNFKEKKRETYFIYVIYSINFGRYYVGLSADVKQRLKIHNSCKVKSTKVYAPLKLIHNEEFETRIEARKREKYIRISRRKKLA